MYYRPCLSCILSTHLVFASGFLFVPVFWVPTILTVVIEQYLRAMTPSVVCVCLRFGAVCVGVGGCVADLCLNVGDQPVIFGQLAGEGSVCAGES
jgi:hypothetical protein